MATIFTNNSQKSARADERHRHLGNDYAKYSPRKQYARSAILTAIWRFFDGDNNATNSKTYLYGGYGRSPIGGRITAEASKYNTLQTTVNNHTASIQQHSQSINGLKAQWTMKVESGGVVAGIGLASSNGKSRFAIRADVLDVVSPDGTKRPMFSVLTRPQTINGVSVPKGVYLDSAYIANGSIDIAKINKASIQSLSALSANIGHFKSAETGARLEIKDGVLLVYDDNNRLRVRLGVW